ncbi:hypothetical protein Ddye_012146 [Dipteronia dyeriana]|uniref:Uncharacterized protein n=1 Tax=Dipteronia dyeriana TaxID=168575 RepID=A0AAD9X3S2_9ROSI|nr:hypothetical protein Ddye_012146 [Dipteronia dyeriana]
MPFLGDQRGRTIVHFTYDLRLCAQSFGQLIKKMFMSSMQTSPWDAGLCGDFDVDNDDDGVECFGVLVGRDREGFGGISKLSKLPSNISITLLVDGLSDGMV